MVIQHSEKPLSVLFSHSHYQTFYYTFTIPVSLILAIESSCDDTSAAVLRDDRLLSNVIASQKVHEQYGGVVPELASRAHQQNIVPVVDTALAHAGVSARELDAVAFTRGPGLLGSLLVGVSFAKSFALSLGIPLIEVNHLQAHVLSHFIRQDDQYEPPQFPMLCLLVSGGHTQIILLHSHFEMELLGQTIDDAAGEAIDKAAKIMDLGYPGGPIIDRLAKEGNADAFHFATPNIPGFDYSFSGIKTSFLYFLRDQLKSDPDFIEHHKADLCASIQKCIVSFLLKKFEKAAISTFSHSHNKQSPHSRLSIAIAGGVSANSALRAGIIALGQKHHWKAYVPTLQFCTDNAAMVGIAAYYKYLQGQFADISLPPYTR